MPSCPISPTFAVGGWGYPRSPCDDTYCPTRAQVQQTVLKLTLSLVSEPSDASAGCEVSMVHCQYVPVDFPMLCPYALRLPWLGEATYQA